MGAFIKAVCQSCDFRKRFRYGSAMNDKGRVCWLPAICPQGKFKMVDIRQELPAGYKLYTDPELFDFDLNEGNGIQNLEFYLSPENNHCPNCRLKHMDFEIYGEYD